MRDAERQFRILIIEDDPGTRDGLARVLRNRGYLPYRARSASQGLQKARLRTPDLIFLDLKLSDTLDGITVLRSLRQDLPAVPVVVLTAFATVEVRREIQSQGVLKVLSKPVSLEDLLLLVERMRQRRGRTSARRPRSSRRRTG